MIGKLKAVFGRKIDVGAMDPVLAAVVVGLLGFGVVMVYSASAIEGIVSYKDPNYFLIRQSIYVFLGLVTLLLVSRVDYHRLRLLTYPILAGVTGLLLMSVVGFGHSGGGAARWLKLGPINIQPAEMAKLALVLWLAYSLAKKREQVKSFSIGLLPHLIMASVLVLLCMLQPDFGSAVVLLFLTFTLLFVAGARIGYLMGAAFIGITFAGWAVRHRAYRWERIVAWMDMAAHKQDLAYQPYQSVMSFGSGQVTGMGLGKGLQVLYLPESHTDFVSAIIGEELGFLGILCLCAVYLLIVVRGVRAALSARDDYGAYLGFGIAVMFGAQSLVNLAVAMAMAPTKGLTLPFISYGGSSMLVSAAAMGILLNVSRPRTAVTNSRVEGPAGRAEASVVVATAATFGSEQLDAEATS